MYYGNQFVLLDSFADVRLMDRFEVVLLCDLCSINVNMKLWNKLQYMIATELDYADFVPYLQVPPNFANKVL